MKTKRDRPEKLRVTDKMVEAAADAIGGEECFEAWSRSTIERIARNAISAALKHYE